MGLLEGRCWRLAHPSADSTAEEDNEPRVPGVADIARLPGIRHVGDAEQSDRGREASGSQQGDQSAAVQPQVRDNEGYPVGWVANSRQT